MDMKRRRELLDEYKTRRPEMGVISFKCATTGESFLGISTDTRADFNSNRAKLSMNYHPNKRLQELWNQYGESNFELSVLKTLKYENREEDHTLKLESLRDACFAEDSRARRIWK